MLKVNLSGKKVYIDAKKVYIRGYKAAKKSLH